MDELDLRDPGFLFVAALIGYAAVYSFWSGWRLLRTHDFTGWKLHGRVDPRKTAQAARYFGVTYMLGAPLFSSVLLIFVLPAGVTVWLYVPVAIWGLVMGVGYVRYCFWHRYVVTLRRFGYMKEPDRSETSNSKRDAGQALKKR